MKKIFLVMVLIFNFSLYAKELSIKTQDGFVLKGWLTFPKVVKENYPIAFFSHEFGSSHKMWEPISSMLRECGYATFEMDLRGHGESILQNGKENKIIGDVSEGHLQDSVSQSEKKVNFKKIPSDLALWLNTLVENEKIDMQKLVFFGSSLGGGALIPLFMEFEPKVVVLFSPAGPKSFGENSVNESISNSTAKILIISSRGDFALENAFEYTKKALMPTFLVVPGSGHGSATFGLAMPYLKTYLGKYLDNPTCNKN